MNETKNTQNSYVLFTQIEPKLIRNLGNVCTYLRNFFFCLNITKKTVTTYSQRSVSNQLQNVDIESISVLVSHAETILSIELRNFKFT